MHPTQQFCDVGERLPSIKQTAARTSKRRPTLMLVSSGQFSLLLRKMLMQYQQLSVRITYQFPNDGRQAKKKRLSKISN